MQIDLPIEGHEAERLRTAVYQFSVMKAAPAPSVEVRRREEKLIGVVDFWSAGAASEFRHYWRGFRAERPSFDGFRDV